MSSDPKLPYGRVTTKVLTTPRQQPQLRERTGSFLRSAQGLAPTCLLTSALCRAEGGATKERRNAGVGHQRAVSWQRHVSQISSFGQLPWLYATPRPLYERHSSISRRSRYKVLP